MQLSGLKTSRRILVLKSSVTSIAEAGHTLAHAAQPTQPCR